MKQLIPCINVIFLLCVSTSYAVDCKTTFDNNCFPQRSQQAPINNDEPIKKDDALPVGIPTNEAEDVDELRHQVTELENKNRELEWDNYKLKRENGELKERWDCFRRAQAFGTDPMFCRGL